ncbi:MAG: FAD-dependent oxidoreductase [Planctomycetes bacterium]|nr:FAD-dependent oxidoreductase [Planctomycetota bacterium]
MHAISPRSYWFESGEPREYPPLTTGVHADVAIIGAGITGLTAALRLKQAGRRVVVLEAGCVGGGATGGTSAHLDALPDQGCEKLISDFGESAARQLTAGRQAAIDQIEQWTRDFQIDCDFRRVPAFAYTEAADRLNRLHHECDAARRLGVQATMARDIGLPFQSAGAVRFENQARFHPMKYLAALAAQVHGDGSAIYCGSRAEPPEDGEPVIVATPHGRVTAKQVLLATHSAYLGISQFDMRMAPYQSYVIAAHVAEPPPDALFWDDADPYHYTRRANSEEPSLLLIGGADHKTGHGDAPEALRSLEEYARSRFRVQALLQQWSSEFFEPADGVPLIGKVPMRNNTYVATGFSGTGLTYGTAAGMLLADLLQGAEPPLAEVVSPARFKPLAAAKELIRENVDVAARFVADRFAGDKIDSWDELAPDEGRLVTFEGEQLAAYRDEQGRLHVCSPVCTHAGCHVHWNGLEKTWDCPCHGGRYSAAGERIYGPPPKDLEDKTPVAEGRR